jgi:hypothetical protein
MQFLRAELVRLSARPSIDTWLQQVRKRKRAMQTRLSSKLAALRALGFRYCSQ